MFKYPYTVRFGDGSERDYNYIQDAAQDWADDYKARVFDSNGIEIPSDILYELL